MSPRLLFVGIAVAALTVDFLLLLPTLHFSCASAREGWQLSTLGTIALPFKYYVPAMIDWERLTMKIDRLPYAETGITLLDLLNPFVTLSNTTTQVINGSGHAFVTMSQVSPLPMPSLWRPEAEDDLKITEPSGVLGELHVHFCMCIYAYIFMCARLYICVYI